MANIFMSMGNVVTGWRNVARYPRAMGFSLYCQIDVDAQAGAGCCDPFQHAPPPYCRTISLLEHHVTYGKETAFHPA